MKFENSILDGIPGLSKQIYLSQYFFLMMYATNMRKLSQLFLKRDFTFSYSIKSKNSTWLLRSYITPSCLSTLISQYIKHCTRLNLIRQASLLP